MSRPQKIHPPLKGNFNSILGAIGMGKGKGKRAAMKLARKAKDSHDSARERKG